MFKYIQTTICSFAFLCLCVLQAAGQNAPATDHIIKGKIVDSKTKQPISGVSVTEMDADDRVIKGAKTDIEGNFVLKVANPKNKISVSFIGYKTVVEPLNGRTAVNFSLEDANNSMNEVIVTASRNVDNGMMSVKEKNSTLATSRINAKELEEMQAASIDQALQGRLAGVDITATSGDPGAAMNIRIRGISSISSTGTPLIVVDGMPYETEIPSDFNFGAADEQGYAQLLNIAPSDIREITVLKDAAATSVWGSRAANGVLLITTKRGTVGKPSINYTFKGSMSFLPKAIPMLNGDQYSTLIPEAYMNRLGTTLNSQTVREFNYDPNDPYWYYNYSNNTNWVDAISQQGYVQDHNLSMSGGGEKARYYASVGYFNQKGTTLGTGLDRINTRINLDYNISEKIKIFTSLAYTHTDQNRNYMSTTDGAIRGVAYIKMPNMSVFEYDENGNLTPNYFSPASNVQGTYSRIYNPVAMASQAKYGIIGERIVPRFQMNYDIVKRVLKASFDVQFDINNTKNNSFLPQIATGRPNTETVVNRAYDGDIDVYNVTTKTSLAYTPYIKNENHNVSAYFNFFTSDYTTVNQEVMTSNTASSLLQTPVVGSRTQNEELKIVSGTSQTRSIGAVIGASYNFMKDRYILNATLRGDGNSRFGPNYRYGLFPSVSFRWRLSDEKFMRGIKHLDDLSFRASYGQSGEAPRYDYSFYNRYSTFSYSYLGQTGVYPSSMELKNLKWQTITGINFGTNLSLWQGRVRLDADIYRNRTTDLFFNGLQIAAYTGYNSVNMNVGTLDNQGWELSFFTTPLKKKDWVVDFNFNLSANENVIRKISEFYPSAKGDVTKLGEYLRLLQVNNPFGSFYGYRYKGVYTDKDATIARGAGGKPIVGPNGQVVYMRFNYPNVDYVFQPGDAIYEDVNHDGNINYMDVVYLGNSNPKLVGGFGPSITFKNKLKISTYFNFRYKFDVVNGTKMNTTAMYNFDNQSTAVLRRWRKEGDVTDIPRAIIAGGYNWLGSDRYVEDASFVRFRTITVRYTFDQKVLKKLKMKSLSAYATAENLFTWTNYTGQDPEVSASGSDPFRMAYDYSMTPPSKTLTLGLAVGF
ncbi:SusC/RagA family TonB-linked outer membrane protein [Flavisolibacter ginsenosidimutans]|uniref:SusC/RagA family TonB-linked outer membrane protein n=1 Tax=Flavisolibacter ginsenosidimutans TaxID=661481 RepID=A0A5B8UFZ9_9BACT|nr:SusC/RagA family TonB-linked outer membrane protein [Flavisolibacter ginsenosidimutans]QEC55418.1 SusC/RagA family TonB-linked outer membrane protein [Flavisolibacter ginsenosidimutans]